MIKKYLNFQSNLNTRYVIITQNFPLWIDIIYFITVCIILYGICSKQFGFYVSSMYCLSYLSMKIGLLWLQYEFILQYYFTNEK